MTYPKHLLGKVATRNNLEKAWHDISKSAGSYSHGMSEETIFDFRENLKNNLETIRTQLLDGSYQFGRYRGVTKRNKRKKRPLKIADIRDRVVQRAIARVLENHLTRKFNLENIASHAYIKNKGVQTALAQMLEYHQAGCKVILESDIKKFFDTVNIEMLLKELIFPVLPDPSINQLINDAINIEIGNKDDLPEEDWDLYPESSSCLPQGGYLSPLFSNVYLSVFDREMLLNGYNLVRYADDFLVMCTSISEANKAYDLAKHILEDELKLEIHERDDNNPKAKTRVVTVSRKHPITFLGLQFTGSKIFPSAEKRQKLTHKMGRLQYEKDVRKLLNSTNNLLQGWISAYGFSDINKKYIEKIDQEINIHLWKGLNKMEWKLKPKNLNEDQRISSGVQLAQWYLDGVRRNLNEKNRTLFSKYWS